LKLEKNAEKNVATKLEGGVSLSVLATKKEFYFAASVRKEGGRKMI